MESPPFESDPKGFWERPSGHVIRWILVPFAAVAGILLGQLAGGIEVFFLNGSLPFDLPQDWRDAIAPVIGFFFTPFLFVVLPSYVAPRGRLIVAIVLTSLIVGADAVIELLGHMGIVVLVNTGIHEVLWVVIGIIGLAIAVGTVQNMEDES